MAIVTSLLIIFTTLLSLQESRLVLSSVEAIETTLTLKSLLKPIESLHRFRRSPNERVFAPKFTHQPHTSPIVKLFEPHSIECPVESEPPSDIKWFKDGQLLQTEPAHLEQSGKELMFFQINEDDSGDYICQASNELGTATSEPVRLNVQSTQFDSRLRLEPQRVQISSSQTAEFTCRLDASLPATDSSPPISWRRNGKRLAQVIWLGYGQTGSELDQRQVKYLAKQLRNTARQEFSLLVRRVTLDEDNNSSYSCALDEGSSSSSLARESNEARLLVVGETPVRIEVNMAPPIEQLQENSSSPRPINANGQHHNHHQQQQQQQDQSKRPLGTLGETLSDLFEIARPSLIVFAIMLLVGLIVLLNLIALRRRARSTSRYMKHHQFLAQNGSSSSGSAASGSSASSSASSASSQGPMGAASLIGDPMLSSLLSRTLSAPSAASFAPGKKYKQYRDQKRKVGQTSNSDFSHHHQLTSGCDFLDAASYFNETSEQQFYPQQAQLPNLYNQSLAAREQARSLLQASEHMRSLNNLLHPVASNKQSSNHHHHHEQRYNQGSHLNLPLSFSFDRQPQAPQQLDANKLMTNSFWNQVVNSGSSISPGSSSATPNSLALQQRGHLASNHYSTIEADYDGASDYDDGMTTRYEQLNEQQQQQQQQPVKRTSSSSSQRIQANSSARSSGRTSTFMMNASDQKTEEKTNLQENNKSAKIKRGNLPARSQSNQYHDQLSPYAVSSICNPQLAQNQQIPPPPPPVTSEAMRALNEQFDINQLVLLDDSSSSSLSGNRDQDHMSLPFQQPPPPPPPPPTDTNESDTQQ